MAFDPDQVRAFEYAAWQRVASNYSSTFAGATSRFADAVLDAAEVGPETRLLDIACGPGLLAAAAAARGALVTGVDFSPAMLAVARSEHPQITFVEGDMHSLPFSDGMFQAVVSNFGIHHAPDPLMALRQAHRVLVRGGKVAFATWIKPSDNIAWKLLYDAVTEHGNMSAVDAPAPAGNFAQPEDISRALEGAGFSDVQVEVRHERWPVANAENLLACLQQGTARTAAVISAQDPSRLPAITAHIARHAEQYREGSAILVPIAAFLGTGRRTG